MKPSPLPPSPQPRTKYIVSGLKAVHFAQLCLFQKSHSAEKRWHSVNKVTARKIQTHGQFHVSKTVLRFWMIAHWR